MDSTAYIVVAIGVLAIVALLFVYFGSKKKEKKLSKLATFALILILTGVVFGDSRIIAYSFMGLGIIICIIDIILKIKEKK